MNSKSIKIPWRVCFCSPGLLQHVLGIQYYKPLWTKGKVHVTVTNVDDLVDSNNYLQLIVVILKHEKGLVKCLVCTKNTQSIQLGFWEGLF